MRKIPQTNAVNRTVGHRRIDLVHVAAHVFEHVDRVIGKLVVTAIAVAYLRIAHHEERIAVARLAAAFEPEFGTKRIRAFGYAFEKLRQTVFTLNFIPGRDRHRYETAQRKVAVQPEKTVAVGFRRMQAVAHNHTLDRLGIFVQHHTLDIVSRLVGDLKRVV